MATDREAQLLREARAAGVVRPVELANFMAQVGHESGGLRRLEEGFIYTRNAEQVTANVRSALRQGRDVLETARLDALAGRPEALAELMYGGRMGNLSPGDGYRYRGRGYIQLTGRDQYAEAGQALGLDLLREPQLAALPEHATRIALWYWQRNVPPTARDDPRAAGAAINGADPPNGLEDRQARFAQWQRHLESDRSLKPPLESPAGAPTFDDTMRLMLPPQAGTAPHITGEYGERRGAHAHGGTDFNYVGGQTGLNLAHPAVHSPVAGEITFAGGAFGTVKVRDAGGHSHEILHLHRVDVAVGQRVEAGDPIGTMGGRGPEGADQYARHVHYQLRDPRGSLISPEAFWDRTSPPIRSETGYAGMEGVLREGHRGPDVRQLQAALAVGGYADRRDTPLTVDGHYGPRTGEAVRAFQQAHGLDVDGIVGPETWRALAQAARSEPARADLPMPDTAPVWPASLDGLLAAARGGDAGAFRVALADFATTPALQGLHGVERASGDAAPAPPDLLRQDAAQR